MKKDELAIWAEKTAKQIDGSAIFIQLYNSQNGKDLLEEPLYLLQLAYAIMMDKPIAVLIVYGDKIPDKLKKIADVIEFYDRGSIKSIGQATEKAIKKLEGIKN